MKWGLYAVLFVALLTGLFGGSSVSAASQFDNTYLTTDTLVIKNDKGVDCDVSNVWSSILTGNWSGDDRNGCDISVDSSVVTPEQQNEFNTYMTNVINSPTGNWFVSNESWNENTESLNISGVFSMNTIGTVWSPTVHGGQLNTEGITNGAWSFSISGNTSVPNQIYYTLTKHTEPNYYYTISAPNLYGYPQLFFKNYIANITDVEYPPDYSGLPLRDTAPGPAEILYPDYQYSLSKTGKLSIKYLDNLPHFLTGISWIVIESMTENWQSIDQSIDTISVTPAGWLDETYQLPAQGYYNIRIDHNQQLDAPPWGIEDNSKYDIGSVWIQLHYDGKTVINANTADCEGSFCNTQRPDGSGNSVGTLFKSLDNLNTFGLTQFFTAPINFLATLPAKADNCSPISFPLLGQTISIECLKPRYYEWSATVMNIYTTVLIASTGYLIAFNVFRHIKDVNTPDKDKIEVARL